MDNKLKMNADGTIRAKVLQYKSDGNTLTEKWETLKKYDEGVYYTEVEEYYTNILSYRLVFEKDGVFWAAGLTARANILEMPENRAKVVELRANFAQRILEAARQNGYIRLLEIEVMRRLGYDVAPLFASRAIYRERQKEKDRQQAEENARREQQREEAEQRRKIEMLADGKEKLKKHESVTVEQIELLAASVGYTIHIRTLGFLRGKVSKVTLKEDGVVNVYGRDLTQRNISGTASVIREIAERLKEQAA